MGAPYVSMEVRRQIRELWLRGEGSIDELADRFEVDRATIYRWKSDEGWDGVLRELATARDEEAREETARKVAEMRREVEVTWKSLHGHVGRHLVAKPGESPPLPTDDISKLAQSFEKIHRGRHAILGVPADAPAVEATRVEVRAGSSLGDQLEVLITQARAAGVDIDLGPEPEEEPDASGNGGAR